ncbi:MAG: hypothetical protein QOG92_550, partial [Verrucomicrobiota bacterium]|nr:hypothetical protein [Verrucomicrobiota bacterium]
MEQFADPGLSWQAAFSRPGPIRGHRDPAAAEHDFLPTLQGPARCKKKQPTMAKAWAMLSSPFGARHFVPGYYQPVPPGQKPFAYPGGVALSWHFMGFNPGNRPPKAMRPK